MWLNLWLNGFAGGISQSSLADDFARRLPQTRAESSSVTLRETSGCGVDMACGPPVHDGRWKIADGNELLRVHVSSTCKHCEEEQFPSSHISFDPATILFFSHPKSIESSVIEELRSVLEIRTSHINKFLLRLDWKL